ncbi:MucR family transcriptional regulator [Glacieibacterium megasporae]|uniref:MucR family transcriptional regulator n=1 Tax=Glacieibacterium megasporae TaxID=2835787 RepID=UPI001C1E6967|nr:MucR family transcriptional regulator [Polymorphobacter megasporae]UAJ10637.1 MucR family transcriptional regulator [Polymorphobacter megasporae]
MNPLFVNRDKTVSKLLSLTTNIVASYVSNHLVATRDLPGLIKNVYVALSGAGERKSTEVTAQEPAVSIRRSIKPDFIICLEDGKKLKMLKRHLLNDFGMTPDAYRAKWRLPADYPMVAPNYAEQRRALALKIGLGRKPLIEPSTPHLPPRKERALRKGSIAVIT